MTRYERCVEFECAQEIYTQLRALLMARIYAEEGQALPNQLKIAELMQEQAALYQEQRDLDAHDEVAVARAINVRGSELKALQQKAA
ncbi:hypothetical protein ABTB34_20865, partial [Acinetobacter baumannii]